MKTETQAERIAQETEAKSRADAKKAEQKAEEKAKKAEEEAEKKAEELKKKAQAKAKDAKAELKKEAKHLDENKDNPVYIGNYILWGITAAAVGYGAYQKNSEGKLDVQLAGTVALGLGALGAADYFASK